jgi:hypothetical protein
VAGLGALAVGGANLQAGLAHCRGLTDDRSERSREVAARVYARCMMWTIVAVVILGVGLLIWTSQSFAESDAGQIM